MKRVHSGIQKEQGTFFRAMSEYIHLAPDLAEAQRPLYDRQRFANPFQAGPQVCSQSPLLKETGMSRAPTTNQKAPYQGNITFSLLNFSSNQLSMGILRPCLIRRS